MMHQTVRWLIVNTPSPRQKCDRPLKKCRDAFGHMLQSLFCQLFCGRLAPLLMSLSCCTAWLCFSAQTQREPKKKTVAKTTLTSYIVASTLLTLAFLLAFSVINLKLGLVEPLCSSPKSVERSLSPSLLSQNTTVCHNP